MEYVKVEEIDFDWKGDGTNYRITLYAPAASNMEFAVTKATFHYADKLVGTLIDNDGIGSIEDTFWNTYELIQAGNCMSSEYLYAVPGDGCESRFSIVLAFGRGYGSDPGALHVYSLGENGRPIEVLDLESFEFVSFEDLDGDCVAELIGRPCGVEAWGPELTFSSYSPFHVYKFADGSTSIMALDLQLSEAYSVRNGFGWAGAGCDTNVTDVRPPDDTNKPVLIDTDEAIRLYWK